MGGAFRRKISGTTSAENINSEVPDNFLLEQNYTNPFNPNTSILFSLPQKSYTILEIFNFLGEKVSAIISGYLDAGEYRFNWNAEEFSSGVYFYKLSSGEFIETKKMILLK